MKITKTSKKVPAAPCPGCSSTSGYWAANEHGMPTAGLYFCDGCGAILGRCYRGDSPILMTFSPNYLGSESTAVYFDLNLIGSDGVKRVHGWYNPADMKVIQFG